MRFAHAPTVTCLTLLLLAAALDACGRSDLSLVSGTIDSDGRPDAAAIGVRDGSAAAVEDAAAAAVDAAPDARGPVRVCNPTLPPPGPVCRLPSGRPCPNGECQCDDVCNTCSCFDGGVQGMTDVACNPAERNPPACEGPISSKCNRFDDNLLQGSCGTATPYYCPIELLSACGKDVCPAVGCTRNHVDPLGGTYWCCG